MSQTRTVRSLGSAGISAGTAAGGRSGGLEQESRVSAHAGGGAQAGHGHRCRPTFSGGSPGHLSEELGGDGNLNDHQGASLFNTGQYALRSALLKEVILKTA